MVILIPPPEQLAILHSLRSVDPTPPFPNARPGSGPLSSVPRPWPSEWISGDQSRDELLPAQHRDLLS